ncbi:hypothetical protein PR048_029914 [Dryococelus australis]|uniref:Transposase n=1 Tax=Dryococelus australis TaxID=614101 RepID=A0ABQ9G7Z5_9NEOP|nr:hypothetical protein PR048_029914 [Dryococelus australis]
MDVTRVEQRSYITTAALGWRTAREYHWDSVVEAVGNNALPYRAVGSSSMSGHGDWLCAASEIGLPHLMAMDYGRRVLRPPSMTEVSLATSLTVLKWEQSPQAFVVGQRLSLLYRASGLKEAPWDTTPKVVKGAGEYMLRDGVDSCDNVGLEFFDCVIPSCGIALKGQISAALQGVIVKVVPSVSAESPALRYEGFTIAAPERFLSRVHTQSRRRSQKTGRGPCSRLDTNQGRRSREPEDWKGALFSPRHQPGKTFQRARRLEGGPVLAWTPTREDVPESQKTGRGPCSRLDTNQGRRSREPEDWKEALFSPRHQPGKTFQRARRLEGGPVLASTPTREDVPESQKDDDVPPAVVRLQTSLGIMQGGKDPVRRAALTCAATETLRGKISLLRRHDSHLRKSGNDPAGERTRFALVGGDWANRSATAAPRTVKVIAYLSLGLLDLCFTAFGVGPLVFVRGSMNTEAYCNILDNEMLPTFWRFYGMDPFYFQDDNSTCHVLRATMQWYADSNVRLLNWPAQNPDINLIGHIWDELDHRVRARQARQDP